MAIVAQFWALGFVLAGRAARPSVRRWSSPGGQRVLALAPHPDDEAIGCGGALALHHACGDAISIAYITDGRRSRALGLAPEEMAGRRRQEAMAAAAALGASPEWLGFAEGEWTDAQLRASLRALLRRHAPQIVYAPSLVDFHPEHVRVAQALADALADAPGEPLVRVYQVQVPLTAILTNLVADTSSVIEQSAGALRAYVTQRGNVGRAIRQRRYAAARYGLRQHAEEFWELPAQQYAALHLDTSFAESAKGREKTRSLGVQRDAPNLKNRNAGDRARRARPGGTFRGLRFYPFSDPLAYLRGRADRRRIAGLVQGYHTHMAGASEALGDRGDD
jgi:LmbE family N-acetylglucosaminyl deacetylase